MHTRYRIALVSLALLALSTAPPASAAQEATTDPAQQAAEAARQAAVASSPNPRFQPPNPGYVGCINEPPPIERVPPTVPPGWTPQPGMNGGPGWLISSPRGWPAPVRPGESATLSLTDKLWSPSTGTRWVRATVTGPDGQSFTIPNVLGQDTSVVYPDNAPTAPPTVPGVYTVVWTRSADGAFIVCDGFVVESA
jgi:hypothetical protein